MNREIKFRGFSKELNSWVYGFLQEVDVEGVGYSYIFWQGNTTFVEANSVGQFTGFKDFDGKEIYEGDILEYVSFRRNENKRKEIVEFDEKCGGWYVHKQADALCNVLFEQHDEEWQKKQNFKPSTKHKVRVIGNIYENPELTQTTS